MPLGDSITQADSEHDSYRRPLWLQLKAAGFDVDFVGSQRRHHRGDPPHDDFDRDHEGHWGWRADEVLENVGPWADTYMPDIVLIHLGTNDVLQAQAAATTIDELGRIIDRIRLTNREAQFFLAQLIPVDNVSVTAAIRSLNAQMATLGRLKSQASSPVLIVDQFTGFDPRRDTYDGLHPNLAGEEKMARNWFSALQERLESQ